MRIAPRMMRFVRRDSFIAVIIEKEAPPGDVRGALETPRGARLLGEELPAAVLVRGLDEKVLLDLRPDVVALGRGRHAQPGLLGLGVADGDLFEMVGLFG